MSFKNNDLKGLQIEFKEALGPRFSASEIRLIWRESLRHFFGITFRFNALPGSNFFS